MTTAEKWNKIVNYYNKYHNSPEQAIQTVWENIFAELLGYSRLDGEIDSHRTIRIGSTERTVPDIIICEGNTDLFVVELKQHNVPFRGDKQLLSYLKLLHNNLGILICNRIYIFDYDYNKNDDEQNKIEIEFTQDNPDGIKFIELFGKGVFQKNAVKEFIRQKNESVKNICLIKEEITTNLISHLLRQYFTGKYSDEEFEQAISSLSISISAKISGIGKLATTPITGDITLMMPIKPDGLIGELDIQNNPREGYTMIMPISRDSLISKSTAKKLCTTNGLNIGKDFTFASKNKTTDLYWANPNIEFLSHSWWMLLNDFKKRELHIFNIPMNSISNNRVKVRKDKPDQIDLQIYYNDKSFEDSRSGIKFMQWFVKTISY